MKKKYIALLAIFAIAAFSIDKVLKAMRPMEIGMTPQERLLAGKGKAAEAILKNHPLKHQITQRMQNIPFEKLNDIYSSDAIFDAETNKLFVMVDESPDSGDESPDSGSEASDSDEEDEKLDIWQFPSKRKTRLEPPANQEGYTLDPHNKNRLAFVKKLTDETVSIIFLNLQTNARTETAPFRFPNDCCIDIEFNPHNKNQILLSTYKTAVLYDLNTQNILFNWRAKDISAAFHPKQNAVVLAKQLPFVPRTHELQAGEPLNDRFNIEIWNITNNIASRRPRLPSKISPLIPASFAFHFTFNPKNSDILLISSEIVLNVPVPVGQNTVELQNEINPLKIWNLSEPSVIKPLKLKILNAIYSPINPRYILGFIENKINDEIQKKALLADMTNQKIIKQFDLDEYITDTLFNPRNQNEIIITTERGTYLYNIETINQVITWFEHGAPMAKSIKIKEHVEPTNKLVLVPLFNKISAAIDNNQKAELNAKELTYLNQLVLPKLPPQAQEVIQNFVFIRKAK